MIIRNNWILKIFEKLKYLSTCANQRWILVNLDTVLYEGNLNCMNTLINTLELYGNSLNWNLNGFRLFTLIFIFGKYWKFLKNTQCALIISITFILIFFVAQVYHIQFSTDLSITFILFLYLDKDNWVTCTGM